MSLWNWFDSQPCCGIDRFQSVATGCNRWGYWIRKCHTQHWGLIRATFRHESSIVAAPDSNLSHTSANFCRFPSNTFASDRQIPPPLLAHFQWPLSLVSYFHPIQRRFTNRLRLCRCSWAIGTSCLQLRRSPQYLRSCTLILRMPMTQLCGIPFWNYSSGRKAGQHRRTPADRKEYPSGKVPCTISLPGHWSSSGTCRSRPGRSSPPRNCQSTFSESGRVTFAENSFNYK